MTPHKLLAALRSRGFHVELSQNASAIVVSPAARLSEKDRGAIRRWKPRLLKLLARGDPAFPRKERDSTPKKSTRTRSAFEVRFSLGGEQVVAGRYRPRDGRLFSSRFGFDCETEVAEGVRIPRLALAVASDGNRHALVHPDDVGSFILAHRDGHFVFHNVAFDFWVVFAHLLGREEVNALDAWVGLAKRNHFHDTMLLDMLVRTAEEDNDGEHIGQRDLAAVADDYTDLALDKADPYRLRFEETIGVEWREVDQRFFHYAVPDAIATVKAYAALRRKAFEIMKSSGFDPDATTIFNIDPQAVKKFGVLTEKVQVGAAIALAQISRHGMHTDRERLAITSDGHRQQLEKTVRRLDRKYPELFKHDTHGNVVRTAKTDVPSKSAKSLEMYLMRAVATIEAETNQSIEIPRTPKGQVSRSVTAWSPFCPLHEFLGLWAKYENTAKLCQFLRQFEPQVIRSRYGLLARTGRTTCSSPNLQQVPRLDDFREILVASPGHLLLAVDYKFIELVTLGAACKCRFGASRLADVIAEGIDPHCYTAAMLLGMTYEDFTSLKQSEPQQFKKYRQMAKPVNFGVPGGMGAAALVEYARSTYGVEMTLNEAEDFRTQLVNTVYPELALFLADNTLEVISRNLKISPDDLAEKFNRPLDDLGLILGSARKVVGGRPYKADGTPYSDGYIAGIWDMLNECNRNEDLRPLLYRRRGSVELERRLFSTIVPTLTGRVRGGVFFTAERNTQFQGLAADGAKLALADLVLGGHRVVGFVHDEIMVELPDQGGYVRRSDVEAVVGVIRSRMEEVTYGVPVECEYTLSTCWSKRAELIVDGQRIRAWRPPQTGTD